MTQQTHPPHSHRPTSVWAAARADYECGASLRMVAERHHLNIRTVSRHASIEDWQAPRVEASEAWQVAQASRDYNPEALAEMCALNVVQGRDEEALLLRPDTLGLCRFAFRRAAECAGVSGPTEALGWIRLAQATARLRRQIDVDIHPMSEVDYRRVAALCREETDAHFAALEAAPPDGPDPEMSEVSESVP